MTEQLPDSRPEAENDSSVPVQVHGDAREVLGEADLSPDYTPYDASNIDRDPEADRYMPDM